MSEGMLVVISAPSGAGKTTLCERMIQELPDAVYSISCTTRKPRGDEQHGREYYFLTDEVFAAKLAAGEFIEHATVHGKSYGTLRQTLVSELEAGRTVLLDIDVQGAEQIRNQVRRADCPETLRSAFVDVFIEPPSLDVLRQRLERRGEDTPDVIAERVRNAASELAQKGAFAYRVVNDDLDRAFGALKSIVQANRRSPDEVRGPDAVKS